jgi:hypothetical protein
MLQSRSRTGSKEEKEKEVGKTPLGERDELHGDCNE